MDKHWTEYEGFVEQSNAWYRVKDGPYRHLHRVECACRGCCGPELAREIQEYFTRPRSEMDITSSF